MPACVAACPTGARHFGDFSDPQSAVSVLSRERGGVELMPELGYRPTNRYLPPRARSCQDTSIAPLEAVGGEGGLLGWIDRLLSR